MSNLNDLQKKLGLKFNNIKLLTNALTHSSYSNESKTSNNERLEFLGDAVIELLSSHVLYKNENYKNEGILTKTRAQCVCEEALVIYASHIGLADYLFLGKGEEENDGRKRSAIIADAFEALFAAIYLDQGFDVTMKVFNEIAVPYFKEAEDATQDYKSKLQEYVQAEKRQVEYREDRVEGLAHNRVYTYSVYIEGNIKLGTGKGSKKKEAQQNAAKEALEKGAFVK